MNSKVREGMSCSEAGKKGFECSKKVREARYQFFVSEYDKNPKKCLHCGKTIEYEKRYNSFCSHSCSASHNNAGVCRVEKKHTEKFCLHCKKELRAGKKYCSIACQKKHEWDVKRVEIERTGCLNVNLVSNAQLARRYLRETREIKCSCCGLKEWMGKEIPLVVDHADGNPENWKIENLRFVCGNCNMQLPTFAGRNMGKGRKSRRDFYVANGYS